MKLRHHIPKWLEEASEYATRNQAISKPESIERIYLRSRDALGLV